MDLTFILTNLCLPVIGSLAMSLAVPYVFAKTAIPLCGTYRIQTNDCK